MVSREQTGALIDGLLKFLLLGGTITGSLILPGLPIALEKPLELALDKFDERERRRELKRTLNYMKRKDLISSANYKHGIKITKAGRRRAVKADFANLKIARPEKWDKKWRLVFFDIPESRRTARNALSLKLNRLGFRKLQKSAWIHPFPCLQAVEIVVDEYKVARYVSYIETYHIDNDKVLRQKFDSQLNNL